MYYVCSDVHSNYIALKKILDSLDNKKSDLQERFSSVSIHDFEISG